MQKKIALVLFVAGTFSVQASASYLDNIGVTLLHATTTNLNGSGIRIAQPEAGLDTNNPPVQWEVTPATVGHPASLFTYISSGGSSSTFPNLLGSDSGHADNVAQIFYGVPDGIATNVTHVDNYEADDFYNNVVAAIFPPNINDSVVNQSFTFGALSTNDQQTVDSAYDDYAARYKTLFVSAACNGAISTRVCAPGTDYNCISVGAFRGDSSVGPTIDNGRCKPDITAPEAETSFSTPQVAGAATVLIQAALRGDGGTDINSASDMRVIKALLLNGAVKPADWTNSHSSPLDFRYGAGVLNVFNSYKQLCGGKRSWNFSTNVPQSTAHFPVATTNSIFVLNGWDFNTNTSSATADGVNHYFFNVTNGSSFVVSATLAWNRQQNQSGINNLNLFLYNCANSNLVACSTSLVDNVEHIFLPRLTQGRYDLQVWKAATANALLFSEPYALAFEFASPAIAISKSGTNVNLSWPVYPAGFAVEAATDLTAQNWSTNNLPTIILTNNQNIIAVPATRTNQFFRLRIPNF